MTTKQPQQGQQQLAPRKPIELLRLELEKPSMQGWLQKQMAATLNRNAQQMVNVVLHAASQQPKLAECTPTSILSALCVAAQIGLVPNTALGHAWLVPFVNKRKQGNQWIKVPEATLIVGYQGFVKLVHDAGGVGIKAAPVYAGEPFEYNRAANPPVTLHQHAPDGKRGELVFAYCLAHFPSGISTGEVYDKAFIHERRARSKSYGYRGEGGQFIVKQDSPWVTDPAPMWMKTAVRDFTKQVPKGNDARLERAIEVDNLDDAQLAKGSVIEMVDLPQDIAGPLEEADQMAVEQAQRQEIGPGEEEEFKKWAAEIRQATTPKELGEAMLRIGKAQLPEAVMKRLEDVAKDQEKQVKGARS